MGAAETLALEFLRRQPQAAARQLEALPLDDARRVLNAAPVTVTAGVMSRMLPAFATQCAQEMPSQRLGRIIERCTHRQGAAILRGVSPEQRAAILGSVDVARATALNLMLRYPESAIGSHILPDVLTFSDDLTTSEARRRVRSAVATVLGRIFVLDADHRVADAVNLVDVVKASKRKPLSGLGRGKPATLRARGSIAEAAESPDWANCREMPVVNRDDRFIGVLEYSAVQRAMENRDGGLTAGFSGYTRMPDYATQAEVLLSSGAALLKTWMELFTNPDRSERRSHDQAQ